MTASIDAFRDSTAAASAAPVPPMRPRIHVVAASKRYRGTVALQPLELQVEAGESVFLLGPNGAGKTTLLQLCAGVLRPDCGEIYLDGLAARHPRARAALGFVPQALGLYPRLTVRENLEFFARVLGVASEDRAQRVEHGLRLSGLGARAHAPVSTLSSGMRRRLNFACAALHRPRLLLLDEPTVGVDPQSRAQLYAAIEAERRAGVTLLCATHLFDEADRLADRVLVLRGGRVCADGTPAALKAAHGARDLQAMVLQLTGSEGGC